MSASTSRLLTVPALRALMKASAGDLPVEGMESDAFLGTGFEELGFDSLARVELTEQLRDWSGADLPDDLVDQSANPADLIERVNALLGQGSPAVAISEQG